MEHLFVRVFGGSPQFWLTGGDVLNERAMPSDSTKLLVDLREEVSFRVGGVKNPRFLFPAKKAVDVRWEVVARTRTMTSFFGTTTNLVIGCIPGREGGEG